MQRNNKYILLAEDSPTQAEQLEQILGSEGYLVSRAKDGDEGFRKVMEKVPDLIISDILMPEVDGYEFCRKIRSEAVSRATPFILLTSLNDMEDIVRGLECGADNYITKPVDRTHLISMIRNLLASGRQAAGEPEQEKVNFNLSGTEYAIPSDRIRILNMLLSTYEESVIKNHSLNEVNARLKKLRDNLEVKVSEATRDLAREVEERTRIQEEVRASEQKSRNFIENSLFGVFSVSSEGRFIIANRAFTDMLGYDHPEVLKELRFPDVFPGAEEYRKFIGLLKDEGALKNLEVILKSHAGDEIYVILNIRLKNGIISGMALDITRQKRIQKKEEKFQKELEIAKVKAEDSDRLKSMFLSNLSHEVRTPMNTIIGFSSLLDDPDLTPETRSDFIRQISDSSYELYGLIENILEISKLDAGQIRVDERIFQLNRLMRDIYQVHAREKRLRGKDEIRFRLHTPSPQELYVKSDPYAIYKIFAKLIDNAFRFTLKGSIDFGYEIRDAKYLMFYIKDTGIGMTKEQIRVIFGSFITAGHYEAKIYSGAGLGLSICIKTLDLLRGEIWVESEPGRGAEFHFKIPMHITNARKQEKPQAAAPGESRTWTGRSILVVEDDPDSFASIADILSPTGASVTRANDGTRVLERCRRNEPCDLILMDLQIPGMTGTDTLKAIRNAGCQVPVLGIMAFASGISREKMLQAGFNDVIPRPVIPEVLFNTLEKYVRKA